MDPHPLRVPRRAASASVCAVVLIAWLVASLPIASTAQTSPLVLDITEAEVVVPYAGKEVHAKFNGTVSVVFPPPPFTGEVVVNLTAVTTATWAAVCTPSDLTFTKTEAQAFTVDVTVPTDTLGVNDTTLTVNANAMVNGFPPQPVYPVDNDTARLVLKITGGGNGNNNNTNNTNGGKHNNTTPPKPDSPFAQTPLGMGTIAAFVGIVVGVVYLARSRGKGARAEGKAAKLARKDEGPDDDAPARPPPRKGRT